MFDNQMQGEQTERRGQSPSHNSDRLYPQYVRQEELNTATGTPTGSEGTDGLAVEHTTGPYIQPRQNQSDSRAVYAEVQPAVAYDSRYLAPPGCGSYGACARPCDYYHQGFPAMSGYQPAAYSWSSQAYPTGHLTHSAAENEQGGTRPAAGPAVPPWDDPTAPSMAITSPCSSSSQGLSASHYFSRGQGAQQQHQQQQQHHQPQHQQHHQPQHHQHHQPQHQSSQHQVQQVQPQQAQCGCQRIDAGRVILMLQFVDPHSLSSPHASQYMQRRRIEAPAPAVSEQIASSWY